MTTLNLIKQNNKNEKKKDWKLLVCAFLSWLKVFFLLDAEADGETTGCYFLSRTIPDIVYNYLLITQNKMSLAIMQNRNIIYNIPNFTVIIFKIRKTN